MWVAAYEDNVLFLGSALAFDALLAALPFAFVLLAALGFAVHEQATPDVAAILGNILPSAASDASMQRLRTLVASIVASRVQLSAWGIPLFLWFATRLFAGARAALNEVFDTEETRSLLVRKGTDLLMVIVAVVLITANAVLTVLLGTAPWAGRFVAGVMTFGLGVILFWTVYVVLPSRPIRWDTALVAAAVASLAFETAKKLFGLYLTNFATVDRIVSNANAIALLLGLLWLYVSACIFLIGGEVADTYDLMRRQREQRTMLA